MLFNNNHENIIYLFLIDVITEYIMYILISSFREYFIYD